MTKIIVFSPEFFGGGAERVLSHIVNNTQKNFFSACFFHDVKKTYLQTKPTYCMGSRGSENKSRYQENNNHIRCNRRAVDESMSRKPFMKNVYIIGHWLRRMRFLRNLLGEGECIIVSDYAIYYMISILLLIYSKKKPLIIFRPSIDLNYINNASRKLKPPVFLLFKLGKLASRFQNTKYLFQTNRIKRSFVEEGLDVDIVECHVMPNPLDISCCLPNINSGYKIQEVTNISFIGRATFEKGYDRFSFLASRFSNPKTVFHYFGPSEVEKDRNIVAHGWSDPSSIRLHNHLVIIPSRIEGYPNIVIEVLASALPILVSEEIVELFKDEQSFLGDELERYKLPTILNRTEFDECIARCFEISGNELANKVRAHHAIHHYIERLEQLAS
jgi:hypothetical protein